MSIGLGPPEFAIGTDQTALIIGAGLAGCAIASELSQRAYTCTVYDQFADAAAATSAIPVATIQPANSGDEVHTEYFSRAFDVCCTNLAAETFNQCGAIQLINANTTSRFPPHHAVRVEPGEASRIAGTQINCEAWYFENAGYLNPQTLCGQLLDDKSIRFQGNTPVAELRQTQQGWQLLSESREVIDESQLVIIASAQCALRFAVSQHIPLQLTHGQIDRFNSVQHGLKTIIHGDGYIVPTANGVWSGATHHRTMPQQSISDADTQTNKRTALGLAPNLQLSDRAAKSFSGVRAITSDRLPLIGAIPNEHWYRENYNDLRHGKPANHYPTPVHQRGAYVLSGFGARGATQALFGARLLAQLISGQHNESVLLRAINPARFLLRELRKGR